MTQDPKHIHIEDYNYPLPDERIAKYPLAQRDQSKLLVYRAGEVSQDTFCNIPDYLPQGTLMVFNNTKVIQARLHFHKESGALIEIFLLEPSFPQEYQENFAAREKCTWYCLVGNSKKWKNGSLYQEVEINGQQVTLSATRIGTHGTSQEIMFEWSYQNPVTALQPSPNPESQNQESQNSDAHEGASFAEILDAIGELPIPPYLNRDTEESDKTTYQTVYSKIKGSVAAPTAGLHFTENVLAQIDSRGIDREEVTLHVGAGTFKPVKSEEIGGHDMHTEHIAVRRQTIEKLIAHGGEATAVGTTSVRTLESLYYMGILAMRGNEDLHIPQWMPYECCEHPSAVESLDALLRYMAERDMDVLHSSTQIIIAPGYDYHIVKRIVTNFHQPKSTLLLLVSAFLKGDWHKIYEYALANDFRFLSYGDSSLLMP